MAGQKVKLQSSDGDMFDVEVDIAKQSITIKTMLDGKILYFHLMLNEFL